MSHLAPASCQNWPMGQESQEGLELEVRPPFGGRMAQLATACIGTWVAVAVISWLVARGSLWAALAGAALAVWLVYFYRLLSVAVLIRGEVLTIRNLTRT